MDELGIKKNYHIGMYGGKFLPFHLGHRYCVEFAAAECDIVHVILFYGGKDEEDILKNFPEEWLGFKERRKKLEVLCKEVSSSFRHKGKNISVIPSCVDISRLRLVDGSEDWDAETPLVRNICGERIDAVYSSEISYGEYFSKAYPEAVHRLVDVPRIRYPISGTKIRSFKNEEERRQWMV